MTDLNDLPVVKMPGSEGWSDSYKWGNELEAKFPSQCAHDFAEAICYNSHPFVEGEGITGLNVLHEGANDEDAWVWYVWTNKNHYIAVGSCDYTGWDCQSGLGWFKAID